MADFATLVLGAETSGLKKAEPALDAVIAKAGRAEAATKKLGTSTKTMGASAQAGANMAKAALDGLESEAKQAEMAVAKAGASLDGMARSAAGAGNAAGASAGQVGNLTAQVFDIGMMMQAGQNPFQLMIQQGSQVAQVLGPMGATGALQAFKGVFAQLISPVNLATFAVIGLTAAVVPMVVEFFKGADAGKALADTTDALAAATEQYRAAVEAAKIGANDKNKGASDKIKDFKAVHDEVTRFMGDQSNGMLGSGGRISTEATNTIATVAKKAIDAGEAPEDAIRGAAQAWKKANATPAKGGK